jgi:hypothetical protein
MNTEKKDELKGNWSAIHESVIVGYFCQAVGYLIRKAETADNIDTVTRGRIADAINLSHNPFDPAVGDIVFRLIETKDFPKEYFIFEIKLEWLKGIKAEHAKFEKKWRITDELLSAIKSVGNALQSIHTKAQKAHLYGALVNIDPTHAGNTLLVYPYWETIFESPKSTQDRVPVMQMLNNMFNGDMSNSGFTGKELDEYVKALNKVSGGTSKAHKGSLRLVYAVKNYEMYLLKEQHALALALAEEKYKHDIPSAEGTSSPKSSPKNPQTGGKLGKRI